MNSSFNEKLTKLLTSDLRFVDDEGELIKAAVIDRSWKIDRELVKLLLSDPTIKEKFFDEIEAHWIFNYNTFIEYISEKKFLANSYTRFRNRIGLNIDGKYLRERGEISLVWPYKDCVLEGGQTKEEEKRKEIFFNEILAQDEIDQLFDPKALTNWKRYTPGGEQKVTEIKRDEDGVIRENMIIKGNNLVALHSLITQFRNKVKLIFIDPPYNTGSDSFGYNDNFNHSSWLTFMKNRLDIAKVLLSNEGIIAVIIGNEEVGYLRVLLDEVFGIDNYLNHITLTTNDPSGFKATSAKIFSTSNHILLYAKNNVGELINKIYIHKGYDRAYKFYLHNKHEYYTEWKYSNIDIIVAKSLNYMNVKDARNDLGKDLFFKKISEFADKSKDKVFRTAAISGGAYKKRIDTIKKSKYHKGEVFQHPNEDVPNFLILNGEQIIFYENTYKQVNDKFVPAKVLTDIWTDIRWTGIAPEGNVKLKFGKKPEKLIQRILLLITKKDDIVLDYHLGSGTTCAVAHKMKRQYIGIEQLDYEENDSVVRLKNVIGKRKKDSLIDEYENYDKSGISKVVNWQGGGDFIYCELKKYNEAFMDKIQAAKTSEELIDIWEDIAENSFLNWYINPEMPEQAAKDFEEIGKLENGLEKQKELLCEMLNKNQLYVNLSEIDDEQFAVSEQDKKLNKLFYGDD